MASNQAGSSSGAGAAPNTRQYTVRVPKGINKKFSILKFNPANNVDFPKCGGAKMERENNFREYKNAYDIDMMPKFGAGSEYGREQKDEARRKKFGIIQKKYNPDDQPWIIKMGADKKNQRKFKGVKGGGLLENASYYVFTQSPDGSFEAFPLKEWYNFMPVAKYKALNADEAEEQFERRDKTLNYFSVMLQKRLKNEDIDEADLEEEGKKGKKKKGKKDFKLTELDEWAELSDGDSESDASEAESEGKPKKTAPKDKKKTGKKSKKKDRDVDAEASEDSDDLDEGAEVDYMTDTDSEDEDMYKNDTREKSDKYADKGVEDEDGLRKVIASDDEDENEDEKKNNEEEEEDEDTDKPKKDNDSDSESSDSGSESDPEKSDVSSALFLQKKDKPKSRSNTPTLPGDDDKKNAKKRKHTDRDSPLPKKSKTDSRPSTPTPAAAAAAPAPVTLTPLTGTDAQIEEAVKRYLSRKPMPIKDLLQKVHKSTNISKETLMKTVPVILKRLNPEKKNIAGTMHLHLKKV